MSRKVNVMVLTGNGINCEMETAHACRLAGADRVDITYLWDFASGHASLASYDFLCLPGGFLDGDDLGCARASAIRLRHTVAQDRRLIDHLTQFAGDGGLILGICNGFQLMVKLGLLPAREERLGQQQVTLTWNDSGRFEDRWVDLIADPDSNCVFTRGVGQITLPVRHGEGKIVCGEGHSPQTLLDAHQVPLRYADPETGEPTTAYPHNPNGTPGGMASLSDPTGRLFGLMPHPEAFVTCLQHPRWTRDELPEQGDGLTLFCNAVDFIRDGNR